MQPYLPEDDPWDGGKIQPLTELKNFLLTNRLHGGSRGFNVIASFLFRAMEKKDL